MNQGHIEEGEIVNLRTLNDELSTDETYALVKTSDMEVIRMVMSEGKETKDHSVKGEVSIQCLDGSIEVDIEGQKQEMESGDWLFLEREREHAVRALTDAVLLVTILFTPNN